MEYIVGVGASAGGLEALTIFFKNMPFKESVAFVVVQHLSPDYKSMMDQLLEKYTQYPRYIAQEGLQVVGGNIYLIPPNHEMRIRNQKLYLKEYKDNNQLKLPIDVFFTSLAEDMGSKAIAVILSGTGSDGSQGIRKINENTGVVIAQDEFSAQFNGMPKSAIYTGLVDFVLPPEEMGRLIFKYIDHRLNIRDKESDFGVSVEDNKLKKIYNMVKKQENLDLSVYKQTTIKRRIERQMAITHSDSMDSYIDFLETSPKDIHTLSQEVLINVSAFFRDPESFDRVEKEILPKLFENNTQSQSLRLWVPGCSTGEEAYSLGILLLEYMEKNKVNYEIKIFATDISEDVIGFAANGVFPSNIAEDIPHGYLAKYFRKNKETYIVQSDLRELVVFTIHNVFESPPFNNIDLISCRNVLIYFGDVAQRKVLNLFDYSLKIEGYLFLGPSESIGDMENQFKTIDRKWKIYIHQEKLSLLKESFVFPERRSNLKNSYIDSKFYQDKISQKEIKKKMEVEFLKSIIMKEYMPSCVVVDSSLSILLVIGKVYKYLRLSSGEASFKVTDLIQDDYSVFLGASIRKALTDKEESFFNMQQEDSFIRVTVKKVTSNKINHEFAVIFFEEKDEINQVEVIKELNPDQNAHIQELEKELKYTRENLQAVNEELETSNEELQATNEELMSANEELQSTNEELQSVNEELLTLNSEYQEKNEQLKELNDDVNNLFNSTNIGTLFLDRNLCVRKFTPSIGEVLHLMDIDIGRSITHIASNIRDSQMLVEARRALEENKIIERIVTLKTGKLFLCSIKPYKTSRNRISGVVITFVDVTDVLSMKE